MSRTVESIGDNVVFFNTANYQEEDCQDLLYNLQATIHKQYPSFCNCSKFVPYPYRENQVILENDFVSISISNYCDCGAISVFIRRTQMGTLYTDYEDLAEHWLRQCFLGIKKIIRQYVDSMVKIGTFSNGKAVYRKEG